MDKDKIKNIALILMFIGLLVMGIDYGRRKQEELNEITFSEGYVKGYNDTMLSVAQQQTTTGDIFYLNNNTLDMINIKEICGEVN